MIKTYRKRNTYKKINKINKINKTNKTNKTNKKKINKTLKKRGGNGDKPSHLLQRVTDKSYIFKIEIPYGFSKFRGNYTGLWQYDKPAYKGIMTINQPIKYIYEGEWINGKPNGIGKFIHSAMRYEGEVKDNKMHGQGKMTFTNGIIYEGTWENNVLKGICSMELTDGIYNGTCNNSMRNGKGKFISNDNSIIYDGEWKNNKKHGKGLYTTPNFVYEGNYENDKITGEGKLTYLNTGVVTEGDFSVGIAENGVPFVEINKAKVTYPDGSIYVGNFINIRKQPGGKTYTSEEDYSNNKTTDTMNILANNPNYNVEFGFENRDDTSITSTPYISKEELPVVIEPRGENE